MKRFLAPILLIVFLFPSLALGQGVSIYDLVERKGLFYEKSTNVPFSGKIDEGLERGLFRDGKREGPWVWYFKDGQLRSEGTAKDGKKEGLWVDYHDNGQLLSEGTYKDGKREGPWVHYYKDGTVWDGLTGTYKDGEKVE